MKGLIVAAISALVSSSFSLTVDEPQYFLKIKNQGRKEEEFLRTSQIDFKIDRTANEFLIFANEKEFKQVSSHFDDFQLIERAKPLREKLAIPSGYLDLEGIWDKMYELQRSYPAIIQVVNMTSFGPGYTYENREMPMLKVSDNVGKDEDEPNILIVSAHHSREIVTPHVALDTVERLAKGYYSGDSELIDIVNNNEVFVAPLWNPDGYNYVWTTNNMWRKNRKPNGGNAYGVDQNRNYDAGWDNPQCSGSTLPSSDTYKGPFVHSEEETQIMVDFSSKRNFVKMNDYHSTGREVLIGFLCEPLADKLDDFISTEAITLGQQAKIRYATRRPSSDGEHHGWHIRYLSSYSFITEIALQFQPSFESAVQEAEIVWPLTKYFLKRTIPYSGHVFTRSSLPLEAEIRIKEFPEVQMKSGETFGSFYIYAPDGTYTMTVSAQGYQSLTKTITIVNSRPQINQDVFLSTL